MTGFENHDFEKEIRNTALTWFEKGIALNDDSAQEVSFYHKALKLDSGFAPAHYRLGAIYMRQARFEKAEQHFALFWSLASRAEKEDYNIHLYTDEQTLEERLDKQAGNYSDEHQSGVSIPYHPVGNQIVVRVVLDGNIRSDMLLDTGASITVIAEQLARLGRFPVKGNIRLHNISRNAVSAKIVRLQSLQVGPLSREGLKVAVADMPSLHTKGVDGILGMDMLQGMSVHIDRKNQKLILE